MSSQATFEEELVVFECPLGHHRYWTEERPGKYESIPCERCGASCVEVNSFTFNPFDPPGLDTAYQKEVGADV